MRFIVKNSDIPTTNIIVPVQITTSLTKLEQAMKEYFPDFKQESYQNKSFDYRIKIRQDDRIKSVFYAHIRKHALEEQKIPAKYLGPKGLEIQIYYTDNNDKKGRLLLQKMLALLPIKEMGEEKTDEQAGYYTIIEWYFHQTQEQQNLEKNINEALKNMRFPKQQA